MHFVMLLFAIIDKVNFRELHGLNNTKDNE